VTELEEAEVNKSEEKLELVLSVDKFSV